MNQVHSVPHPITLADAHSGVPPHRYVIMQRSQHCQTCNATHNWSELFALTHLRSQLGKGKYITNLRPLDAPRYNLPIERRPAATIVEVPFCHACPSISLDSLPDPPSLTITNRIVGGPSDAKPSKDKPKPPSVKDIMDQI
jgi:hypothetical protein